jgi:lysophospholipase L1-like esterase
MGRQTTKWRPRRASRLVLVGSLLLVAAGCFAAPPPPPPPSSAPSFPGYPTIAPYSGSQCKTVLLVGDSLMTPISNVQEVLEQSGRCATVVNAAVNGTAPSGTLQGVDWSTRLQALIDQHHPQVVVIQFVGNGFDGTDDAAWLAQQQAGIINLVDIAKASGVPYVAIAPVVPQAATNLVAMNQFLMWQLNANIPGAMKIDLNPYLAPGYKYTEYLTFPEGILKVRSDLVHLNDLGSYISGYVIAAAIAHEWT